MNSVELKEVKNGEKLIKVTNECSLSLTLSSFGAGLFAIDYGGKSMLSHPSSYDDYANSTGYYGKTVGPVAGRIPQGKYKIGYREYQMPINENGNCLHSATLCYAFAHFDYEILEKEETIEVIFKADFPSSESAFPANAKAEVIYSLSRKEPSLRITMKATPDEDSPLNITNHAYFNLGGEKNLYEDLLTLKQGEVARYSSSALLLDHFEKASEELDFSSPKPIGKDIDSPSLLPVTGYDHCFLLLDAPGPKAVLENRRYRLEIDTDAEGLQIYSSNFPKEGQLMQSGHLDERASGITFEPVSRMDRSLVCKKGATWTRHISYRFIKKEK